MAQVDKVIDLGQNNLSTTFLARLQISNIFSNISIVFSIVTNIKFNTFSNYISNIISNIANYFINVYNISNDNHNIILNIQY